MVKEQFAAARKLIDKGQHSAARALLEEIDHPAAAAWLERLDKIEAAAKPQPKGITPRFLIVVFVLFVLILAGGLYGYVLITERIGYEAQRDDAQRAVYVWCSLHGLSTVACKQAVDKALDEDVSRASSILFCGELYKDDNDPRLYIDCLADRRVYLPVR